MLDWVWKIISILAGISLATQAWVNLYPQFPNWLPVLIGVAVLGTVLSPLYAPLKNLAESKRRQWKRNALAREHYKELTQFTQKLEAMLDPHGVNILGILSGIISASEAAKAATPDVRTVQDLLRNILERSNSVIRHFDGSTVGFAALARLFAQILEEYENHVRGIIDKVWPLKESFPVEARERYRNMRTRHISFLNEYAAFAQKTQRDLSIEGLLFYWQEPREL